MKKFFEISLVVIVLLMVSTGCSSDNVKNTNKVEINSDGVSENDIISEGIIFSNINLAYSDGITNLTATMRNDANDGENFNIIIVLKDDDGNRLVELNYVVENLNVGGEQLLQTGIIGDFSYIKNVEFDITNN